MNRVRKHKGHLRNISGREAPQKKLNVWLGCCPPRDDGNSAYRNVNTSCWRQDVPQQQLKDNATSDCHEHSNAKHATRHTVTYMILEG